MTADEYITAARMSRSDRQRDEKNGSCDILMERRQVPTVSENYDVRIEIVVGHDAVPVDTDKRFTRECVLAREGHDPIDVVCVDGPIRRALRIRIGACGDDERRRLGVVLERRLRPVEGVS